MFALAILMFIISMVGSLAFLSLILYNFFYRIPRLYLITSSLLLVIWSCSSLKEYSYFLSIPSVFAIFILVHLFSFANLFHVVFSCHSFLLFMALDSSATTSILSGTVFHYDSVLFPYEIFGGCWKFFHCFL